MSEAAVHLIDATGYLFRAYHAIPSMKASDGTPTNGVYGFAQTLLKYLREAKPPYVAAVFDASMTSFRNALDATYKANRLAPPADLEPQFDLAVEVCRALGVSALEADGFEADDVIATLARRAREAGRPVVVISFDKDLAQLVCDGVTLLDLGRGGPLDAAGVEARFGVPPSLIADFLALCGDSVDNVPGIPGIGHKTAAVLLKHYGGLEALLLAPERVVEIELRGRDAIAARVRAGAEAARLGRRLTALEHHVPIEIELDALRYRGPDSPAAAALFERLGFRRLTEAARAGTLVGAAW
jgi:DNA polymerase-1